jgi:4-hydroxybutyrate CoA-transferase
MSSTERAKALIGVAHPNFREELSEAAKKMFLI